MVHLDLRQITETHQSTPFPGLLDKQNLFINYTSKGLFFSTTKLSVLFHSVQSLQSVFCGVVQSVFAFLRLGCLFCLSMWSRLLSFLLGPFLVFLWSLLVFFVQSLLVIFLWSLFVNFLGVFSSVFRGVVQSVFCGVVLSVFDSFWLSWLCC